MSRKNPQGSSNTTQRAARLPTILAVAGLIVAGGSAWDSWRVSRFQTTVAYQVSLEVAEDLPLTVVKERARVPQLYGDFFAGVPGAFEIGVVGVSLRLTVTNTGARPFSVQRVMPHYVFRTKPMTTFTVFTGGEIFQGPLLESPLVVEPGRQESAVFRVGWPTLPSAMRALGECRDLTRSYSAASMACLYPTGVTLSGAKANRFGSGYIFDMGDREVGFAVEVSIAGQSQKVWRRVLMHS
jgi:hypothetical protein